jgi:hypothetical protein
VTGVALSVLPGGFQGAQARAVEAACNAKLPVALDERGRDLVSLH